MTLQTLNSRIIKFNTNDYVLVRLTDYGRTVHKQYHDDCQEHLTSKAQFAYKPPVEDEHGWSRWQLWELISIFGPRTSMTMMCFETAILIET